MSEILALIGRDGSESAPASGDLFANATKKQLLDCAARLGLTGVSKLSRDDLAGRIEVAFAGLRRRLPARARPRPRHAVLEPSGARRPVNGGGSFHKFDLGPTPDDRRRCPRTSPGATATTAITAMPVDPTASLRLLGGRPTTRSTPRAPASGPAGERAWLNVRVYDITGRLFDGTNAHSYFDHRVERHERQWFFGIDKPTSTACAEIGLKSEEGYFVKIARSGRVDFPRNEPVGDGGVEWLSVRGATGPVGNRWAGSPAARAAAGRRATGPAPVGGGPGGGAGEAPEGEWTEWTERGRLSGAARPAPVRAHLDAAGRRHAPVDQRVGADRMGRPRAAHGVGVGPVHVSGRRCPRGASRSRQRRGRGPHRKAAAPT